jgi:hypothetical protein
MKDLTSAGIDALNAGHVELLVAYEQEISGTVSETIRVHTGIGEKTIEGETYLGVGSLGSVSPVKQEGSAKPSGISVELSGIDPTLIQQVFNYKYQGRPARLIVVLLDTVDHSVIDTHTIFKGKVNVMNVISGAEGKVSVSVENKLVDWMRADKSKYTQPDYERGLTGAQAGDKFFSFVNQVINKQMEFTPYQNWKKN